MKKSAETTGRNIVNLMMKQRMEIQQKGKPTKNNEDEHFLAREHIEYLRKFLAMRYPRLDNPKNTRLSYCRPDIELETFNPDEVDAPPNLQVKEINVTWEPNSSSEKAICFIKDGNENQSEALALTYSQITEPISRSVSREH